MMPGANADSIAIEDRRQIVRMNVAVREWNDARPMVSWSVDGDALDLREPFDRDPRQRGLVLGDPLHSQLVQIGDRGGEPDCRLHVGRPTFELVRDLVPGRAIIPNPFYHFA